MKFRLNDAAAIAACALIVVFANAADTSSEMSGSWRVSNWTWRSDRVQLELTRSTMTSRWVESRDYALDELHGLNPDQLRSLHSAVRFEIVKDAGAFVCEGSVTAGVGGGTFQFEPSKAFAAEMRKLGFGDLGSNTMFSMAVNNVDLVFVRAVQKAGPRNVSTSNLISLRVYGVTAEYIADVKSIGYDYSADDLVHLKTYGVPIELLRGLKKQGYDLSSDEVIKLRNYGVTSDYVRGIAASGQRFSVDEIVKLKTYGIQPEFVQDLKSAGYSLPPNEVVDLHNQGVSADYARDVKRAHYNLESREIIQLRQYGVSPDFLNQLHATGYERLSTHDIVKMWQNGVRADYIARLQSAFGAGARNLSPDQIIKLKINGVD